MSGSSEYLFTKFHRDDPRKLSSLISLRGGSIIGLSAGFYRTNEIDRYQYVELFIDIKRKSLGLKFTNSETVDSRFALVKSGNAKSARIMARSFFKNSPLPMEKYVNKAYHPKEISMRDAGVNEPGSMFIIDLEEGQ